ncbi:MAG: ATPase, T2SS/T4P/T4SS family [Deltaproteobacteria bacterium]
MPKVAVLFSTKGGVGRTFIATNLAVSLAEFTGKKRTILVDFDLQFPGDVLKLLDLKPHKSIIELIPEWEAEPANGFEHLQEFILHHHTSKLDFLPVILNIKQRSVLKNEFLAALVEHLGKTYEYVIIDAGSAISRTLFSVLEQSNLVLFVTNPDVLSVSQAKESMDILQSFSFPLKMMRVVLNRAESQGGVSMTEVQQALPPEVIGRIPSDGKAVCLAMNRRNPLVLDNPASRVARGIINLADYLMHHPEVFISHQDLGANLAVSTGAEQPVPEEELSFGLSKQDLSAARKLTKEDRITQLKQRIHQKLIQDLDLHRLDVVAGDAQKLKELKESVKKSVSNILAEETGALIAGSRDILIKEIVDEAIGLGPLEDLIADPEITDILVNNKDQIYVERHGRLELTNKRFVSNVQVRQIIERIVAPLGRRIDESVPMVDGRLADGSRVNAIIPPLALTGPTLTIRKFGAKKLKVEDLVNLNALTPVMGDFIRACVLARKNVIVSGGTGSGKTTVLNVLSEFIPDAERILTIEDAAELKLHHQHWVRLESRPPNIEGRGAITMRDLFRNSLRMRPDRIIIGECRGLETLDMLQAMNTGHDGSMTTLHANSTQDVLSRLDSLILMGGIEIPLRAIREMIASAIDLIVHTSRLSDGSRKVVQISEITGMSDEMHISMKDLFIFNQTGVNEQGKVQGNFQPTGEIPTFIEDLRKRGINLPDSFFKQ